LLDSEVSVYGGVTGGSGEGFVFSVFYVFAVSADVAFGEAEVDDVNLEMVRDK
jgi:hypothetical protein